MIWPRYDIQQPKTIVAEQVCVECKNPSSNIESISIACGETKYATKLCHDCLEEEDVLYDLKEILERMVKR